LKPSGGLKSQISFPGRNVLPRDLRTNSEMEIYYGKPGIFYLDKMLESQNLIVYPEDIVQVFPDPSLGIGAKITIYRATPVVVNDAGARKVYRTWAKTVQEFLDEKAIQIEDKDIVEPKQEAFLSKNMEIRITRVSETTFVDKIGLDFKKVKQDDPNLEKGKTRVVQVGKPGTKERIYKIKRENGKEVSRVLVKEQIVVPPQDEITAYGTKVVYLKTGVASHMNGYSGLVAAFNGVPNGTKILVVNLNNGKSVVVTRFSSGPFVPGRVIDLSLDAFNLIKSPKDSGLIKNVGVALAQ